MSVQANFLLSPKPLAASSFENFQSSCGYDTLLDIGSTCPSNRDINKAIGDLTIFMSYTGLMHVPRDINFFILEKMGQ